MKEYEQQLKWHVDFPENKDKVEQYFKNYWLDKQEYNESWTKIKNKIFNESFYAGESKLNEIFNPDYEFMYSLGGGFFPRDEFESLTSYMKAIGEKQFVIIEDYDEENPPTTSKDHLYGWYIR